MTHTRDEYRRYRAEAAVRAGSGTVVVRYFAGARAAAGVAEERVELAAAGSVADALAVVSTRRGPALLRILPSCSFLLNGIAVHDHGIEPSRTAANWTSCRRSPAAESRS